MVKWMFVAILDTLLIALIASGTYSPAFFDFLNKSPLYLSLSAVNIFGMWTIMYLKYTNRKISKISVFVLLILILPALAPLMVTLIFVIYLLYLAANGRTYLGG